MIVWASGCLRTDIHSTVHETASILGGLCGVILRKYFLVLDSTQIKILSFRICSTRTRFLHCFSIVFLCKPAQDERHMSGVLYSLVNVCAFIVWSIAAGFFLFFLFCIELKKKEKSSAINWKSNLKTELIWSVKQYVTWHMYYYYFSQSNRALDLHLRAVAPVTPSSTDGGTNTWFASSTKNNE